MSHFKNNVSIYMKLCFGEFKELKCSLNSVLVSINSWRWLIIYNRILNSSALVVKYERSDLSLDFKSD